MQARKSLDVEFINDGIAPRHRRRPIAIPVKAAVDYLRAQAAAARQRARVGIDQGHAGIEAMAVLRFIGAMHAKCIVRARTAAARRNQSVPDISGAAGQIMARDFGAAVGVEQTHFDSRRMARKKREIDAALGPGGAQWSRRPTSMMLHFMGPAKTSLRAAADSTSRRRMPAAPAVARLDFRSDCCSPTRRTVIVIGIE